MDYTKGDWQVDCSSATVRIRDKRGFCISTLYKSGAQSEEYKQRILANAHLIAKAPRMYEALKEVRRYAVDVASLNSIDSQVIAGMCYVALAKAKVKS